MVSLLLIDVRHEMSNEDDDLKSVISLSLKVLGLLEFSEDARVDRRPGDLLGAGGQKRVDKNCREKSTRWKLRKENDQNLAIQRWIFRTENGAIPSSQLVLNKFVNITP